MDCRYFRNQHLAFLDNTLSDAELTAMHEHLAECEACARHDTAIRRGLLLFRNLPVIKPSRDFHERLNARLQQIHQAELSAAVYRGPGVGSFIAAAAGVVAAGFLAAATLNMTPSVHELALAPVVASAPELPPSPIVNQGFVASASAGMPLWAAAVLAEQAPVHFATEQFRLAGWGQ